MDNGPHILCDLVDGIGSLHRVNLEVSCPQEAPPEASGCAWPRFVPSSHRHPGESSRKPHRKFNPFWLPDLSFQNPADIGNCFMQSNSVSEVCLEEFALIWL